jgi:hypothetical protein
MKQSTCIFLLSIALCCWNFSDARAQDFRSTSRVGTTAAQFLKISAGARAVGMGGAYTALANDINAIYWNPAGLARIGGSGEATFNHAEWLAEIQYDFAAFSLNTGLGSFGLHVISLRTPEEKVRTLASPLGTGQVWDASSFALGASYARMLTDRFAIGMTGKYIQESLFNETSRGMAFDLGVVYQTPFEKLSLGAAITNFGSKLRLDGRDIFFNEDPLPEEGSVDQVASKFRTESYEIPLTLRFGLALEVMNNENMKIVVAADGSHPNDNTEHINSGVEVGMRNVLFVRGGYKALFQDNSEQGLTLGGGLRYDAVGINVKLDYGWADFGRLDTVQFVSFSIRY